MPTTLLIDRAKLKMVIIRDIVTDFSEDEDIELCDYDTEVCLELSNVGKLTSMRSEGGQVYTWSQHLITTNILGHATKIIRSMLDRMRIDQVYLQLLLF
ncbi:unnamed protein product [Lupinus luteus]|uniref:Uncharacterized protein n=1 Tax=Lupinus luteus TaxID=3873 RepID=A0AAV1VQQ7_LUPLU